MTKNYSKIAKIHSYDIEDIVIAKNSLDYFQTKIKDYKFRGIKQRPLMANILNEFANLKDNMTHIIDFNFVHDDIQDLKNMVHYHNKGVSKLSSSIAMQLLLEIFEVSGFGLYDLKDAPRLCLSHPNHQWSKHTNTSTKFFDWLTDILTLTRHIGHKLRINDMRDLFSSAGFDMIGWNEDDGFFHFEINNTSDVEYFVGLCKNMNTHEKSEIGDGFSFSFDKLRKNTVEQLATESCGNYYELMR